jgi:predicted nucleic acid-binding Zn ribbon protein
MNRRRSPRPLVLALEPLQDRWAPETPLARIQRAWDGVVGDHIAAQAKPVSERGGTLTVACASATWAQELDLMAPDLLSRLNALPGGGTVTRLRCTVSGR